MFQLDPDTLEGANWLPIAVTKIDKLSLFICFRFDPLSLQGLHPRAVSAEHVEFHWAKNSDIFDTQIIRTFLQKDLVVWIWLHYL